MIRAVLAAALVAAADLSALPDMLASTHPAPFGKRPRAAFEADLKALAAVPDEEARIVGLAQAVARLGDAHTTVAFPPAFGDPQLGLYAFEEGTFAIAVPPAAARAVGCRATHVAGLPINEAWARAATLVPTRNPALARRDVPRLVATAAVQRGLGLPAPGRYGFVDAQGAAFSLDLTGAAGEFLFAPSPALIPARGGRRDPYWLALQGDALVLNYRQCKEAPGAPFAGFVDTAMKLAAEHHVRRIVVDLRENGGGSSRVVAPLVAALHGRAEPLSVLIGRRTFSSGMLAALDLQRDCGARLIGEATAGEPNHFGDVRELVLPGVRLWCSTKRFHRVPGDPVALVPDVVVPVRAADWFAGRDAALEAALR